MTDSKKTIECLKELEAKATSGLWISDGVDCAIRVDGRYTGVCPHFGNRSAAECDQIYRDFTLIVAMRNALPELLAELERLEARAEKAEAERDILAERLVHAAFDKFPGRSAKDWLDWAEREAASTVK